MKKITLAVFMCGIFNLLTAQIQKNRIEIRAGVGYVSDSYFALSIDNAISGNFDDNKTKVSSKIIYGADALVRIGKSDLLAEISYGHEELKAEFKKDPKEPDVYNLNNYLAGVQYNYFIHKKFYLYSGLQMGLRSKSRMSYSFYEGDSESKDNRFAYHLTTLGVHYGKNIGVFCETGFGAKGLIRAGIALSL